MIDFNQLNPEQLKAVKHLGSPVLVFAGAGSGKTRALTYKMAYLIEEVGLPPENILAVTFTSTFYITHYQLLHMRTCISWTHLLGSEFVVC